MALKCDLEREIQTIMYHELAIEGMDYFERETEAPINRLSARRDSPGLILIKNRMLDQYPSL